MCVIEVWDKLRAERRYAYSMTKHPLTADDQPNEGPPPGSWSWLAPRLIWLGSGAITVFLLLALLSFDASDPPSHTTWPYEQIQNWCGSVGAGLAYWMYRLLGWSAWLPPLYIAFVLVSLAARWRVSHRAVRSLGLGLLLVASCGLLAVLDPGWTPIADLSAGGTLGINIAAELLPRFDVVGTLVWLLVLAVVSLVIMGDSLAIAAPRIAARVLGRGMSKASRAAVHSGEQAARKTVSWAVARGLESEKKKSQARASDLDADPSLEYDGEADADAEDEAEATPRSKGKKASKSAEKSTRSRKPVVVVEDEEEEEYEEDEEEDADEDEDEEVDEEEEDDDIAGAPQVFDKDALREKIARLPVRFAGATPRSATEEDLSGFQNSAQLEGYIFPTLDLLDEPEANFSSKLESMVREQGEALESALKEYKIKGEVVGIESGPVITLYHIKLAPGTRVNTLQAVSSDIARSLKSVNLRIVPNQTGRDTVGVEVPNPTKEKVRLKELMGDPSRYSEMKLPMFLGKDASGDPLIADLTTMPHMLIAGTTGSGKSVCMNTIIMSFLYTKKPNELKLVLVDPKMVEMSQFKDIPHLMCPVVTEMSKAAAILEWAVRKMDERYELLAEAGCRDISAYNELEWDEIKAAFGAESDEDAMRIPRSLPYMVFIIDELADLMMTNKEVEGAIIRIAQKARAVGIHLILATQRPQANVVTGLIKSNMPCRVSFKVASGIDSRVVLDSKGGELLLGHGDMLFLSPRSSELMRAQGTLVADKEIRRVVRMLRDVAGPSFERSLVQIRGDGTTDEDKIYESENNSSASLKAAQEDPMFDRAVEIVLETKRGSVSLLQRRLAIGYTRASRLVDLMGIAGIISDHKGSVARDVLITPEEWEAMKALAAEQEVSQEEIDRVNQVLHEQTGMPLPKRNASRDGSHAGPAGADADDHALLFDAGEDAEAAAVEVHAAVIDADEEDEEDEEVDDEDVAEDDVAEDKDEDDTEVEEDEELEDDEEYEYEYVYEEVDEDDEGEDEEVDDEEDEEEVPEPEPEVNVPRKKTRRSRKP